MRLCSSIWRWQHSKRKERSNKKLSTFLMKSKRIRPFEKIASPGIEFITIRYEWIFQCSCSLDNIFITRNYEFPLHLSCCALLCVCVCARVQTTSLLLSQFNIILHTFTLFRMNCCCLLVKVWKNKSEIRPKNANAETICVLLCLKRI